MLKRLVPGILRSGSTLRDGLEIIRHIAYDYGWLESRRTGRCVDAHRQPIPWFTYPSIDFITQLDLRDLSVFEYGCGFSTLFWAKRAKRVVSLETDRKWFDEISSLKPSNVELIFGSRDVIDYVRRIEDLGHFDIIVIDGPGESRLSCAQLAPNYVTGNGFIILDNSDLWPNSALALREADLIQVDFTGMAPLNAHWHTTSVFFSRQYAIRPLGGCQPHKSVAQPAVPWPDV